MENESPYKTLYKVPPSRYTERQEDRRKLLLNEQKLQRSKLQDQERFSLHGFLKTNYQNKEERKKKILFKSKYDLPYSLQLSEWLKEKPEDLDRWYLLPCPKGVRCFLIACNGITEVYSKRGKRIFYFHSKLPGDGVLRNEFTVLDCVYCKEIKKFFVLDAVFLGNHDLQYCDASFRHYWIKSRFNDNINYYDDENSNYSFFLVDWIDFEDDESIRMNFMKCPHYENNIPELDGFLFYHKDSSYTFGSTPLIGWLFPFMIPEVLGYEINEHYTSEKPISYVNYLHFIEDFDKRFAKINKLRVGVNDKMEEGDEETDISEIV